ncbi:MAG: hypothetical protein WBD50_02545 [Candidatus Rhabdochlamydia sp.]
MTYPTSNYSNIQWCLSTSVKVFKSIAWVAGAILTLPAIVIYPCTGKNLSWSALKKAVEVWSKGQNSKTQTTDTIAKRNLNSDSISHKEKKVSKNRPAQKDLDLLKTYTDGMEIDRKKNNLAVTRRIDLKTYAEKEWAANTEKAIRMKDGYAEAVKAGYQYMHNIRGDNYCGLRATLFKVLSKGLQFPSKKTTLDYLVKEMNNQEGHWLCNWKFLNTAKEIEDNLENVKKRMDTILSAFEEETTHVLQIESPGERIEETLKLMNRVEGDILLMEAIKLHMMATVLDLYDKINKKEDVPEFAVLMPFRDTSPNSKEFMINHMNTLGDTGGAEQMEMCLLGYMLGTPIKVVRCKSFGQVDFITTYPEHTADTNKILRRECENEYIVIISEDDRHYNVISTSPWLKENE